MLYRFVQFNVDASYLSVLAKLSLINLRLFRELH